MAQFWLLPYFPRAFQFLARPRSLLRHTCHTSHICHSALCPGHEANTLLAKKASLFPPSRVYSWYLCPSLRSSSSFKETQGSPFAEFTAAFPGLSVLLFKSKLLSMFLSGKISGVMILSSSGSEQAGDN